MMLSIVREMFQILYLFFLKVKSSLQNKPICSWKILMIYMLIVDDLSAKFTTKINAYYQKLNQNCPIKTEELIYETTRETTAYVNSLNTMYYQI